MTESLNEKQPLQYTGSYDHKPSMQKISANGEFNLQLNVVRLDHFLKLYENILFDIEESKLCIHTIINLQKQIYDQTSSKDMIPRDLRSKLEKQNRKMMKHLDHIQYNISHIEPSKPTLSDLDVRNQKFKEILKAYKDILEQYISTTLEHQRFISVLFENQIKKVNPNATPFDLERAISSADEDCPSVFVQVLMQRGARKNDKEAQRTMKVVQDTSQDLRQSNLTFAKLSDMRNEINIIIERYRRRWPVVLKEGNYVYIIDDDLNLLEKTVFGTTVDFDILLRQREKRNRVLVNSLVIISIMAVIIFIVSTTLFSNL